MGQFMVTNEVRKVRCNDVLSRFLARKTGCVFFTLTTPDVVDYKTIRERWRNLRHWLSRRLGKDAQYVMNYEVHPNGHGWHIHSVWNCYIDLRKYLKIIQSFGFGRVDVRKVDSKGVCDYLTKHALKAYCKRVKLEGSATRVRLVNTSRGLPCLSDYVYQSDYAIKRREVFRQIKDFILPWSVKRSLSSLAADLDSDISLAFCIYYNMFESQISNLKIGSEIPNSRI